MKRLLVLAAGILQVPVIKKAKDLGIPIISEVIFVEMFGR